jgi:NitT/TauT family transport system substrate-binding protein
MGSTHLTRARALSLLAAAPLVRSSRASAQTAASPTIRIGAGPNDAYAQAFYAQSGGFFAKYGITAQIFNFPNAQAIVQAAVGNALDVGMADMIQLVNPIQKGVPLAYFAGGAVYRSDAPTTLLVVAKSSTVQKPKDLEGSTIGVVALNSISSMSVTEWLRQGGADTSRIKIFELPFAVMIPALLRGEVAAAFVAEPFLSGGLKTDIRPLASTYDTIAKQFYIGAWFGSRDWFAKNPDLSRRFTQALYDTARWSNTHHDDTAPILAGVSKLDPDRIKSMTRSVYATSLDPKLMQPVIDIAVRYNLIEKPVNAADLILKVSA